MYRKKSSKSESFAEQSYFSFREVIGRWVSIPGSPAVCIFFTGMRRRLEFSYDTRTVFICSLRRQRGVTFFNLYGRIEITYDAERDVLLLSDYGEYVREQE
jgi:hypothetical protein